MTQHRIATTFTHRHLVAGEWLETDEFFENQPVSGIPDRFSAGTPEIVGRAVAAAQASFDRYRHLPRAERAAFLRSIAEEIEARTDMIIATASRESGLPEARITGELGRTTGQLRLFANHIEDGGYLDRRVTTALPNRAPLPRPEIRVMQNPVGPVAVFGASNFPLAFSTAGGDTAAALAAGCPVVVKGHSAHPGTSDLVAQAINAAIHTHDMPSGVFSQIQGGNRAVGTALVQHPLIRAVAFTGSLAGGRALFDLCAARPDPIPFFGELGSVNPMFFLPDAIETDTIGLAKGWVESLTMGAGQFCTNPGIAVLLDGPAGQAFCAEAADAMVGTARQAMLTPGIASACRLGRAQMKDRPGVKVLKDGETTMRDTEPGLFAVGAKAFLNDEILSEEIFGPIGLVVLAGSAEELISVAQAFPGQLTATIHAGEGDTALAGELVPILEQKAGRLLWGGFPTGVEVCDSMVHGGPYPASTNFGHTSVGTLSIRRFLRPVSYQGFPHELLPGDLNETNLDRSP